MFFLEPDGNVRQDLTSAFPPEGQDPIFKYFYGTATPLVKMMALVAVEHILAAEPSVANEAHEDL